MPNTHIPSECNCERCQSMIILTKKLVKIIESEPVSDVVRASTLTCMLASLTRFSFDLSTNETVQLVHDIRHFVNERVKQFLKERN